MLLYAVWTSNYKWLLIVDGELFLFLSCQHPDNFVPMFQPSENFPCGLYHSLSVDLSNTALVQTGLINDLSENVILLICGGILLDISHSLVPQFMLAHNWKANEVKRCKTTWTKEHSKQSGTNKIKFIYQQIHEKETLLNITNILI